MDSVEEFLAHTIQLENEAALRFGQLADAMRTAGNTEVAQLFRQLADYSLLHLGDARERAGYRNLPTLAEADYQWPDIESPEAAAIWAADPFIGIEQALQVRRRHAGAGGDFFQGVGPLCQAFKQLQPHAAQQHLGMHESGHEVEQLAGAAAHQPAGEHAAAGPAAQGRAGHPAVDLPGPAFAPAAGGGRGCGGLQCAHGWMAGRSGGQRFRPRPGGA